MSFQVAFNNTRYLCHRCWQRTENAIRLPVRENVADQEIVNVEREGNVAVLQVPAYMRAPNTARHCVFNNCRNNPCRRVPDAVKEYLLIEYKLYLPPHVRVCLEHLQGNAWNELIDFCNVTHDFDSDYFTDVCTILTRASRNTFLDFERLGAINEDDMHFWTGFNNNQFQLILEETPSLIERCREPRQALGIYLTKLRTGDSNDRLASQFRMSRRSIGRKLKIVRECLTADFVDHHLGLDHITRENILERNQTIPKGIFGNEANTKAIIICDGTYLYIQKSSNFLFQRLSYSLHKFQNLLKPFLLVSTDGHIIDILGPFAATKSDASIMSELSDENNALHWLLEQNDVFIFDRGFRDAVDDVVSCGYEVHLPPTKDRNETQLTTDQANKSRLVTICRWVIEVINGRFKRDFKLLRQDYFNSTLTNAFTDFKIAGALLNAFRDPVTDNVNAEFILNKIHQNINLPNHLFNYVNENNLNRQRVAFMRIDANELELQDFPRVTEHDIKMFALGSYQVKLAKSYCGEHIQNGLYMIEVFGEDARGDMQLYNMPQNSWLLRGRIQSRHVRSRTYYCYILIHRDQIGMNAICQYYCTCLTGRRTVGSCAHITSIIWYIGYARHEVFNPPAAFLNDVIVDNIDH